MVIKESKATIFRLRLYTSKAINDDNKFRLNIQLYPDGAALITMHKYINQLRIKKEGINYYVNSKPY